MGGKVGGWVWDGGLGGRGYIGWAKAGMKDSGSSTGGSSGWV